MMADWLSEPGGDREAPLTVDGSPAPRRWSRKRSLSPAVRAHSDSRAEPRPLYYGDGSAADRRLLPAVQRWEVAGTSPVEPATKTSRSRTASAAPVVNVTENVTTGPGRRVSADFRGGIVYRATTATSFCVAAIVLTGLRVRSASSRRHADRVPASARRWSRRVGRARRHGAADSRASFVEAEHGRVKSTSQTVPHGDR